MITYHYASNDVSLLTLSKTMYDAYIEHFDIDDFYLKYTLLPEKNSVIELFSVQTRLSPLNEICIAVDNDIDLTPHPVGMMVLTQDGLRNNCRLGRVIVSEGYRRRGIAKNLINHAISYARINGACKILLDVNFPEPDKVPPSFCLYHSVGFKQVGTMGFRREDDTKLMELDLKLSNVPVV